MADASSYPIIRRFIAFWALALLLSLALATFAPTSWASGNPDPGIPVGNPDPGTPPGNPDPGTPPGNPDPGTPADQGCGSTNNGGTGGANGSGPFGSTCDGSPLENGNGSAGENGGGPPCAGCVGNADDKNPPGQGTNDNNNGYECDDNSGVGQGNPAHSGCSTPPPGCTVDCSTPPPGCTVNCSTPPPGCTVNCSTPPPGCTVDCTPPAPFPVVCLIACPPAPGCAADCTPQVPLPDIVGPPSPEIPGPANPDVVVELPPAPPFEDPLDEGPLVPPNPHPFPESDIASEPSEPNVLGTRIVSPVATRVGHRPQVAAAVAGTRQALGRLLPFTGSNLNPEIIAFAAVLILAGIGLQEIASALPQLRRAKKSYGASNII